MAAGFALWGSISEAQTTRLASGRDLLLLALAATLGAASVALFAQPLAATGAAGSELTLPSVTAVSSTDGPGSLHSPAVRMGLQGACAGLLIVLLKDTVGLCESVWAITASTYVIAGSRSGTIERSLRRIAGTAIGVPLGLACLPIAEHWPMFVLGAAALALVVYAMAMPERYDIACGAYAFALVVTLAVSGETSLAVLAARAWETLLGGALGLAAASLLLPVQPERRA